jgi:eukaryotic-like serine/threonine-protein kinase
MEQGTRNRMSTTTEQLTLAERLNEGRMPVSEALHCAMSLADALRKLHDAGKYHGALTPASVVLKGNAVELIPSLGPVATVTPFTAPEIVQGQAADARSDIFSFGTLVFEMLTGRHAFDGQTQTEMKLALVNSAPPASGSPAVDRLVTSCVAKSPAARWQRMQKIILELKLLTVAARRADAPSARAVSDAALQQMEARFAARLAGYEKTLAAAQQASAEALQALQEKLEAVEQRPAPVPEVNLDVLKQQVQAHVDEAIAAVTQQLQAQVLETVGSASHQHDAHVQETVAAAASEIHAKANETIGAAANEIHAKANETIDACNQRMAAAEQNMEEIRKHFATLQSNVAGDLHDFETTLKAQGVAIESARTAMAQTDDLVERVVEALELLQTSMIDQHETASVN